MGNKNAVGNSGKSKYIESPDMMLQLFNQYREEAKSNPYLKHDFVGKDAGEVWKRIERPLSWVGFECYLFDQKVISDLSDYEENTNGSYIEYLPIIRAIKKYIDKDQFEGASAGIYQQNIIARKLGLTDKKDVKLDAEVTEQVAYRLPDGTIVPF